jgi:hypothetical protein
LRARATIGSALYAVWGGWGAGFAGSVWQEEPLSASWACDVGQARHTTYEDLRASPAVHIQKTSNQIGVFGAAGAKIGIGTTCTVEGTRKTSVIRSWVLIGWTNSCVEKCDKREKKGKLPQFECHDLFLFINGCNCWLW